MMHKEHLKHELHQVGLDIGCHTIKGVEVLDDGSETVVQSAGALSLSVLRNGQASSESAVIQAVKDLWTSARFSTRRVTLALPPESVYAKWHQLDANDDSELEHIVHTMAPRGAPFPTDDAVVDYRVLPSRGGESPKTRHVMMVTAESRAVERMLTIAEKAGLEPIAVDMGITAAARSLETQERSMNPLWGRQPRAHVLIGAGTTTIAVIRGSYLEFSRSVPVGGNDFTQRIADETGTELPVAERIKNSPDACLSGDGVLSSSLPNGGETRIDCDAVVSRLAREILRSIRFFSSQFAEGSYLGMIGSITMSGGGALMRGLDACFRLHGVDVTSLTNPFAGLSVDAQHVDVQQVADLSAAYTTAVGLATANYGEHEARREEYGAAA